MFDKSECYQAVQRNLTDSCKDSCVGLYSDVEYEAVDQFDDITKVINLAARGKNALVYFNILPYTVSSDHPDITEFEDILSSSYTWTGFYKFMNLFTMMKDYNERKRKFVGNIKFDPSLDNLSMTRNINIT